MTLGNMRANGMHTLAAWCLGRGCGASSAVTYPDDLAVPSNYMWPNDDGPI